MIAPSTTQYSRYQAISSHSTGNSVVPATSHGQFLPAPSSEGQFTSLPVPTSQVTSTTNFRSSVPVPYRLPPNAVIVKVPISSFQNQSYQYTIPTHSPSPPIPSASLATSPPATAPPTTAIPLCCSEC